MKKKQLIKLIDKKVAELVLLMAENDVKDIKTENELCVAQIRIK